MEVIHSYNSCNSYNLSDYFKIFAFKCSYSNKSMLSQFKCFLTFPLIRTLEEDHKFSVRLFIEFCLFKKAATKIVECKQ